MSSIQFKIPKDSTEYWAQRFKKFGLEYQHTDNTLQVLDFDKILLEFIEVEEQNQDAHINVLSDVPAAFQITGLWGSRLYSSNLEQTRIFSKRYLGVREVLRFFPQHLKKANESGERVN